MTAEEEKHLSPKRKKKKRGLQFLILVVSGLLLILCSITFRIPPTKAGYLVFLGLAYPAVLVWNFVLLLYCLLRRRSRIWIPLVTILLGWDHLTSLVQFSTTGIISAGEKELKVMTWNVHLFGLYEWENNRKIRDSMFKVLEEEKADILCLQEFYHSEQKGFFTTRDTLVRILPTRYYHERYTHSPRANQFFGVILMSRYPIVGRGHIPFQGDVNNYCIWADLRIGDDTVRVYNAHLQSVRLSSKDYEFVAETGATEDLREGSHRIGRKIRRAFLRREEQVNRLIEHISGSPHPIILCGDFNDPPHSWSYNTLTRELNDSFKARGNGLSNTLNISSFPPIRIDFVLHGKEFRPLSYRRLSEARQSDHFPVVVTLALPQE